MGTKVSHDVFEMLKEYSKVGTKKESIYRPEILAGTEKERKAIRRKIRNSRDNMISAFNDAKNDAERAKIAQVWTAFAKKVYVDINYIFEANTTDDKAATIADFVSKVNKILATAKK